MYSAGMSISIRRWQEGISAIGIVTWFFDGGGRYGGCEVEIRY